MQELHNCKVCGFLSTHGQSFMHRSGLLVCKSCATDIDRGAEPVTGWFKAKIASEAATTQPGISQ